MTQRRISSAFIFLTALSLCMAAQLACGEEKAKEPILPMRLFKNHTFTLTSLLGAVIGAGMFGAIIMLPLYLQIVKGNSATAAGLRNMVSRRRILLEIIAVCRAHTQPDHPRSTCNSRA